MRQYVVFSHDDMIAIVNYDSNIRAYHAGTARDTSYIEVPVVGSFQLAHAILAAIDEWGMADPVNKPITEGEFNATKDNVRA